MKNFTIKDLRELKNKSFHFVSNNKTRIIGVTVAITLGITGEYALVNSFFKHKDEKFYKEYIGLLENTKSDPKINFILNDETITRSEKVEKIYAYAINQNANLEESEKEILIDAFTGYFISKHGEYLSDEAIYNMATIAKTEDYIEMPTSYEKYDYVSGYYTTHENTIAIKDIEMPDLAVIAHEQIHAAASIPGTNVTGLLENKIALGINEGMTEFMSGNCTYSNERKLVNMLGIILSYDSLFDYYWTQNFDGLVNEISKYTTKEEATETFKLLTENTSLEYDLSIGNNRKISLQIEENQDKIKTILKHIFEAKYKCKWDESDFGKFIFSEHFSECYGYKVGTYSIGYDFFNNTCEVQSDHVKLNNVMQNNLDKVDYNLFQKLSTYCISFDLKSNGNKDVKISSSSNGSTTVNYFEYDNEKQITYKISNIPASFTYENTRNYTEFVRYISNLVNKTKEELVSKNNRLENIKKIEYDFNDKKIKVTTDFISLTYNENNSSTNEFLSLGRELNASLKGDDFQSLSLELKNNNKVEVNGNFYVNFLEDDIVIVFELKEELNNFEEVLNRVKGVKNIVYVDIYNSARSAKYKLNMNNALCICVSNEDILLEYSNVEYHGFIEKDDANLAEKITNLMEKFAYNEKETHKKTI